jgi:hypothetical protein
MEFVRCLANKVLEMDGRTLIDKGTAFVLGDEQPKPSG